jgi:hypothetical protein
MQNKQPLPPRTALPVLRVATTDANPSVPDNFPFDKYDLEPSELSDFVRRELSPSACWPVIVSGRFKRAYFETILRDVVIYIINNNNNKNSKIQWCTRRSRRAVRIHSRSAW